MGSGSSVRTRPLSCGSPDEDRERVERDFAEIYARYLATLPPDRIALLMQFSYLDIAHKVVGVGSVGPARSPFFWSPATRIR